MEDSLPQSLPAGRADGATRAITLSNTNLAAIGRHAGVPSYDRGALKPGILHFGVGNFHRAHLASYLDTLFNQGRDHDCHGTYSRRHFLCECHAS